MVELVCLTVHLLIILYGFYIFLGTKFFPQQKQEALRALNILIILYGFYIFFGTKFFSQQKHSDF